MKNLFSILFVILSINACDPVKKEVKNKVEEVSEVTPSYYNFIREPHEITPSIYIINEKDLLGYWVGDFTPDYNRLDEMKIDYDDRSNKINISIDSLAGDSVFGHSVVAGNRRPFNGRYKFENNIYSFAVSEPGDDKYDGVFNFSIAVSDSVLKGTWASFGKVKTPFRKYSLNKKIFKYDPEYKLEYTYNDWTKTKPVKFDEGDGETYIEEGMLSSTQKIFGLNPSLSVLTARELETLTKGDLIILRNSIYAKHGYSFKKQSLRYYFDGLNWYIPVFTDIKRFLTDIEKTNIKNMLNYEKHAEEYYDVFGR